MNKEQYPNPIFIREDFEYLNGKWQFSYDNLSWREITVPFSPETELSGIRNTAFIKVCYYKKVFRLNDVKKRVLLYFGAVDYETFVYINGNFVGDHKGGATTFSFDITPFVKSGDNEIFLCVRDQTGNGQCHGKQSFKEEPFGCFYTRTTGIYQDVWLEFCEEQRIKSVCFYPDVENSSVGVDLSTNGTGKCSITVKYNDKTVGCFEGDMEYRKHISISLSEKHLWEIGKGELYDVELRFEKDVVFSYFGLREVGVCGRDFVINGNKTFQKLVLDQGYYPLGGLTAPSIADMQKDITLALDLGFNGARLHQKVFEPKRLFLCDKAGFMVWGEFPSVGADLTSTRGLGQFLAEWEENVSRDFNHPSITLWCPLNEVWGELFNDKNKRDVRCVNAVYSFTKILDGTRPCVDVSGGHHGDDTDLFDFHYYASPEEVSSVLERFEENDEISGVPQLYPNGEKSTYKKGSPVMISECGGSVLAADNGDGWGYTVEADANAFVKNYEKLLTAISACSKLCGFCYTQLFDVEQEKNGFYKYDRSDKLSPSQKSAIKNANAKLR